MKEAGAVVVLQIGPLPGSPGGMAAVIEEITRLPMPGYRQVVVSSWGRLHGPFSLLTALGAIARMTITVRRWDIAHIHMSEFGSFVREGIVLLSAKSLGKPVVVTLHGARFADQARTRPRTTRYILERASCVLCLGTFHREIVQSVAPRARTALIANPVSIPENVGSLNGSLPAGRSEHAPAIDVDLNVVFVGEVGARKGIDRLLAAWPQVRDLRPRAELRIAGPLAAGDLSFELDGVTYLGSLDRRAALKEMAAATVLVLPSRAEVLPMVILESLSLGTPAIYTRVGEWEIFASCEYVDLVEADHVTTRDAPNDLALAILRRLDAPLTPAQRAQARAWAKEFAGPETVGHALTEIYDRWT